MTATLSKHSLVLNSWQIVDCDHRHVSGEQIMRTQQWLDSVSWCIAFRTVHLLKMESSFDHTITKGKPDEFADDRFVWFDRFSDESSSQDFLNTSHRKLADDQSEFAPINCTQRICPLPWASFVSCLVEPDMDCKTCLVSMNDLFLDKHTLLPCLESKVRLTELLLVGDVYSLVSAVC